MTDRRKEMTVGELRKALEGIDDAMPVVVDATDDLEDDYEQIVGGVSSVGVEYRCAETPSFFINASPDVGGERDEEE